MTQAQEILETWRNATRTVSIAKLARKAGADLETDFDDPQRYWHFADGSCLITKGRGKSYQAWVSGGVV